MVGSRGVSLRGRAPLSYSVRGCQVFATNVTWTRRGGPLRNVTPQKLCRARMCSLDLLVPRPDESPMDYEGVCVAFEISSLEWTELRKRAYSELRHDTVLRSSYSPDPTQSVTDIDYGNYPLTV